MTSISILCVLASTLCESFVFFHVRFIVLFLHSGIMVQSAAHFRILFFFINVFYSFIFQRKPRYTWTCSTGWMNFVVEFFFLFFLLFLHLLSLCFRVFWFPFSEYPPFYRVLWNYINIHSIRSPVQWCLKVVSMKDKKIVLHPISIHIYWLLWSS